MRKLIISSAIFMFLAVSTIPSGCAKDFYSFDDFIDDLLDSGASVQLGGEVTLGLFSVKGRAVRVNGELTNVLQFDNKNLANEDAAIVHPDGFGMEKPAEEGSMRDMQISWIGPPHFYSKGRLIVVYIDVNHGADPSTRNTLESILGSQFAGQP